MNTLKVSQIQDMLVLQDKINSQINRSWMNEHFPWYRAIWVESSELLDHYGWKWWKHQEPDIEQVKLELIDIWHFGLSEILMTQQPADKITLKINGIIESTADVSNQQIAFPSLIEDFALATLSSKSFPIPEFFMMLKYLPMPISELYKGYIGKNVLNRFRQNNGYKSGSYIKIWAEGKEDNVVLADYMASISIESKNFEEDLYLYLTNQYENLKKMAE